MCSNYRYIDSVESHLDDLVCSFEDFVKKSLIIVSVAVGAVVVMLMYVLKVVTNRPSSVVPANHNALPTRGQDNVDITMQCKNILVNNDVIESTVTENHKVIPENTRSVNTSPVESCVCESEINNIGYTKSYQPRNVNEKSQQPSDSKSRQIKRNLSSESEENTTSRSRSKLIEQRNSCCSICCEDDVRRS